MRPELVLSVIAAAAAVTFALRYLPMILVQRLPRRPIVEKFLKALPIGILAALVAQSLFLRGGSVDAGMENYHLPGFAAVVVLAALTRNLSVVVFGGVGVVALLTWLGGA